MSLTMQTAAAVRRLHNTPQIAPAEFRQPFDGAEKAITEFSNAIDSFYPDLDETDADGAQGEKGLVRYRTQKDANQVRYEGNSSQGEYVHEFLGGGFIMTRYTESTIDNYQVGPGGVQHLHLDRAEPSRSWVAASNEPWAISGGKAPGAPPQMPADSTTTPSGLEFATLASSVESETADPGEKVMVHYTGWLSNGEQFDSSRGKGKPFSFDLGRGQVIRGWDEGVAGMKAGEKRLLQIPAHLAYGERAVGSIPPNSPLTFEVELLSTSGELDR